MSVINREDVHSYSEACADMGENFQPIAMRLSRSQRRLMKYLEEQFAAIDPMAGQVAMFMATVCLRVFEQAGGDLRKVNGEDIRRAEGIVQPHIGNLLPADDGFSARAKEIERGQPHLMDEVLWALFDRAEEEMREEEMPLSNAQSAQIYMLLWVAVEALNAKWNG